MAEAIKKGSKANGYFDRIKEYDDLVKDAAKKYNLDVNLIRATLLTESNGDPKSIRYEKALGESSYGLGHILLSTARGLGFEGPPENLFIPEINIEYVGRHFDDLRKREPNLSTKQMVIAYNAGRSTNTPTKGHIKRFFGEYYDNLPTVENLTQPEEPKPLSPEAVRQLTAESPEQVPAMSAQLRQPEEASASAQRAIQPSPSPQAQRPPMTTEEFQRQFPLKPEEERPYTDKEGGLLSTQGFGERPEYYGTTGLGGGHEGLDFRMKKGTPVYNTLSTATVEFVGNEEDFPNTYGNFVLLKGPENDAMLLAHLDSINVKQGQTIKAGDLIGPSGQSGGKLDGVPQPHLHVGYGPDFEKVNKNVQNFAKTKKWLDQSGGFEDPTVVVNREYSKKFINPASPTPITDMNKQIIEATGSAGTKASPVAEAVGAISGTVKNLVNIPKKAIENRIGAVKNMASSLFNRKPPIQGRRAVPSPALASYRTPQQMPQQKRINIPSLPQLPRTQAIKPRSLFPSNIIKQNMASAQQGPINSVMQRTIPATFSNQPTQQRVKTPSAQVSLNSSQFGNNQLASFQQPTMNYNMFRTPPPKPAPTQSFNISSGQSFSQPSYSAPANMGGGGGGGWTVQSGQTLSGIAQQLLGDANRYRELTGYSSGNPNLIYPGEQIRVG